MKDNERKALMEALSICASNWGWWNPEDPPIVASLPKHPTVQMVIDDVRKTQRSKYNFSEQSDE